MDDADILNILTGIFFGSIALVYITWFGCVVIGGNNDDNNDDNDDNIMV